MPFGPIFRAMTRNRARFVLIVAEVALTLAIVANCVSLIRESKAELAKESGFDDANLLAVSSKPFSDAFREEAYVDAATQEDLRVLRAVPGVRAATNTYFRPWSGGGSSTEVSRGEGRYRTQVYPADLQTFDTLGVRVLQGRNFTVEELETFSASGYDGTIFPVVISQKLADLVFPRGGALGEIVEDTAGGSSYRVVGVFGPFYNPYGWPIGDYAMFYPSRTGSFRGTTYLVRTQPGQAEAMIPEIEKALLAANNGRNVEIKATIETRRDYDARDRAVVTALNSVMLFLIIVTALGIVGITSFSVAERKRQIGTRRALGATQGAILGHFLLENWIVTTCGAALGLGLAYALNFGLVTMVEGARIDGWILAAGVGLLWATGFGAALGPALKAARTAPAIATRNVDAQGLLYIDPVPVILIVEDQPSVATALRVLFEIRGLDCLVVRGPGEALRAIDADPAEIGVVIQDMNFSPEATSGEEGIALFREIRRRDPGLPVLLMTAWTSLETAVQLVKEGASDYLAKPWDDEKLLVTVRNLLRLRELQLENQRLRGRARRTWEELAERHDLCGAVWASAAMQGVVSLALQVARADVPVLVTGPSGSGKEKVAEIVQANSRRKDKPFVRVNAGAIPDELLESELFGAEAGAYTGANRRRAGRFEAADGGTLFLDEIGNLSLSGQRKLLRVLQSGQFERLGSSETRRVDVRLICATNADLSKEITAGRFREDLFYRLNVVELAVPPLSERPEDVLPLVEKFLRDLSPSPSGAIWRLSSAAKERLLWHTWPGNVRELENALRRAVLVASGDTIGEEDLGLAGKSPHPPAPSPASPSPSPGEGETDTTLAERIKLERALAEAGGVVAKAAEGLGLSRQALYRKMEKHGLAVERRVKG